MSSFYVNGNIVKCEGSMSLLRYLRDELRLTSVKDGCSEGRVRHMHRYNRRPRNEGLRATHGQAGRQAYNHHRRAERI